MVHVTLMLMTLSLVWNVFMDFALAILPITLFWKLQLSPKKKISVCLLMSLGIL